MSDIIYLSSEELLALQAHFAEQDLAQRPKDVRLEDIMLFRGKGARLIKSKNICFDDEDLKLS